MKQNFHSLHGSSDHVICLNKTSVVARCKRFSTHTLDRAEWKKVFEAQNYSQTDWYNLSVHNLNTNDMISQIIKNCFKGSLYRTLSTIYPEMEWHPWKFVHQRVPGGYWQEPSNQRKFFDDLGQQLGVKSMDDWYSVLSVAAVKENGGSGILKLHSLLGALQSSYPDHEWIPWKFETVPMGFWHSIENQRQYFDWLGKQLGVKELDGWYSVLSNQTVINHGGMGLLFVHNRSATQALKACYPEHKWLPWKFAAVPKGFWYSQDNRKWFFEWLGKQLGVNQLDDWYSLLSRDTVVKHGGAGLLNCFPLIEALKSCYPEHNWKPWKFNTSPLGFWSSPDNITQFISDLAEKLSIQTLDDWYRVDFLQLHKFGATRMLQMHGGLYNILMQQFPHHPWDPSKFHMKRKGQRWLVVVLQRMFPGEEILEDYTHPKVFSPSTQRPLQFDAFIPSRSLALEYQGKQHYEDVGIFQPSKFYQKRDAEKRFVCRENNIKLIEVPYWWNRTQHELLELIENPLCPTSTERSQTVESQRMDS